jgi:hypothetical protein
VEELHYQWRLLGLSGVVVGLFMPKRGEGLLTFRRKGGRLESELLITSPGSEEGEFWRYGSRLDLERAQAVEAWSDYLWRGKSKSKRQKIERPGVLDIVSGIYSIRRDPPSAPRRMEIWSDGKIYPVQVIPKGSKEIEVGDNKVEARRFDIRALDEPDGRRWKGEMEIWLTSDPSATPVEIRIQRSLANLRLRLEPAR